MSKFVVPEPSAEATESAVREWRYTPDTGKHGESVRIQLAAAYAVDVPGIVRQEVERALREVATDYRRDTYWGHEAVDFYLAARFGEPHPPATKHMTHHPKCDFDLDHTGPCMRRCEETEPVGPSRGEPETVKFTNEKFDRSFDARDWAKAFVEAVQQKPSIATDESTMLGWFANALMRGHDEHARRQGEPSAAFDSSRVVAASVRHAEPQPSTTNAVMPEMLPSCRACPCASCGAVRDFVMAMAKREAGPTRIVSGGTEIGVIVHDGDVAVAARRAISEI